MHKPALSAEAAKEKLKAGNAAFLGASRNPGDISPSVRERTCREGQCPYAVVVACSDSRVTPESIFSSGIGELFVIRVAGNVLDRHQIGSVEYAVSHLGCRLVVVLGHTHCGAVAAALQNDADGFIRTITDEIRLAAGDTTDPDEACRRNVVHGVARLREVLSDPDVQVCGAIYDIADGTVRFL